MHHSKQEAKVSAMEFVESLTELIVKFGVSDYGVIFSLPYDDDGVASTATAIVGNHWAEELSAIKNSLPNAAESEVIV